MNCGGQVITSSGGLKEVASIQIKGSSMIRAPKISTNWVTT